MLKEKIKNKLNNLVTPGKFVKLTEIILCFKCMQVLISYLFLSEKIMLIIIFTMRQFFSLDFCHELSENLFHNKLKRAFFILKKFKLYLRYLDLCADF